MSDVEQVVSAIGWIQIGSTDDSNKINRAIDMLRAQARRVAELEGELAAERALIEHQREQLQTEHAKTMADVEFMRTEFIEPKFKKLEGENKELQAQLDRELARARVAATVDVGSTGEAFDILERAMVDLTREKSEAMAQLDRANIAIAALADTLEENCPEDSPAVLGALNQASEHLRLAGNPHLDHTPKPAEPRPVGDDAFKPLAVAELEAHLERANERIAELQSLGDAAVAVLRHEPSEPRPMSEGPPITGKAFWGVDARGRKFRLRSTGKGWVDAYAEWDPARMELVGWLPTSSGGEKSDG